MTRTVMSIERAALSCAALAAALLSAGCPDPGGGPDAAPEDVCNSLQEALTSAGCVLQENTDHLDYISVADDEDWFSFTTPATMDARSLLRVTGGYGAPATPVQLSINVLREDGTISLGRVVDLHGQGAPQPLQVLTRFTEPSTCLVLLLSDQPANPTRPQFDIRSQYLVKWDVLQDPDSNEPNDATPTAIQLGGTTTITGSGTGILATPDDVDLFSFSVPAAGKVLYFHIGEATPAPKPLSYRLAWTLYDPAGTQVGEGRMNNEFLDVDLATARLTAAAGAYRLAIHAYRPPGTVGPLPGDERLTYRIDVLIVDQLDANEPNDNLSQANGRAVSLAPGATRTFTGRIGYVSDPDWYAVDLAADAQPRVLHYRVLPPGGTGRFPPLPLGAGGLPDREVTVVTEVTQGTSACRTDPALCPKGYGANPTYQLPVEQVCGRTPAQCLWSAREEDFQYASLKNFEGRMPVAPHAGGVRYYLVFQDVGNDWADDRNYTLEVSLEADPDENSRAGLPGQTVPVGTMAEDTSGSTFPAPPAGASAFNGVLSFGYSRLFQNDPTLGQGIRGPGDYDAVPSDVDRFQLDFPAIDPSTPIDRTWELQWTVTSPDGGAPPTGLSLEVEFCDGTRTASDGGSCAVVNQSQSGAPLVFGYTGENLRSWWNGGLGIANQPLWDRSGNTVTARAYGCFCFEPRFIQGGRYYLKVGALDRNSWDLAAYTVRTAFTAYPKSFPVNLPDGGIRACPAVNDAGTPDAGTLPDGGPADAGPAGPRGGCEFTR